MAGERTRRHKGTAYVVGEAHPAADAFPWLDDDGLQELADDIAENGQRLKIVRLPDNRVVDGRNRELACRIAGIEPQYRTEKMNDAEAVAFVISANLHRRELSPSQRSMVAAELANMRQGERTDKEPSAPVPKVVSQAKAARSLEVSERSVRSAVQVKRDAPELVEIVRDGALDVKTAAKVAKLPAEERKKVAKSANPKKAAKEALKKGGGKGKADQAAPVPLAQEEPDDGKAFVELVEALCRDVDQIVKRVKALKDDAHSYSIHIDSAASQIEAARKTLWQGRPAHVCPYCDGKGCKTCNQTGRVKKTTYDSGREAVGGAA